jgi:catechol 2,3-dioxygenase
MQESTTKTSLHPDTHIGVAALRVADLERSLRFYEGILGFKRLGPMEENVVNLGGQDEVPLLQLHELKGAEPLPYRATGLYHVAILLPTRPDLGRELIRMAQAGLEIGQGDHLVSEALYISDPDGNGLELYRDRPRSTWQWDNNGHVRMAADPVDIQGLIDEGTRLAQPWEVLPKGTTIGHVHLKIGNVAKAIEFYHTILGFDIVAQMGDQALFISAGGYHHHIGLNTWQSRGGGATPQHTAGIQSFVIAIPNREALAQVRERLVAHTIPFEEHENTIEIDDPWNIHIILHMEL